MKRKLKCEHKGKVLNGQLRKLQAYYSVTKSRILWYYYQRHLTVQHFWCSETCLGTCKLLTTLKKELFEDWGCLVCMMWYLFLRTGNDLLDGPNQVRYYLDSEQTKSVGKP